MNQHDAVAAPIDALPDDVLKLVFEEAYQHRSDQNEARDIVVIPTFVSRRWREVTISVPSLWACIHINNPNSIDLPKLYLSRAGSLPLDVHCASRHASVADDKKSMSPEIIQCLESFLELCADRVQRLDVDLALLNALSTSEVLDALHVTNRHPLINLTFLRVNQDLTHEYFVENGISYSFFFPNLKTFYVHGIPINFISSTLDTLQQLTICDCALAMSSLGALSKSAPQLLNLTLGDVELTDLSDPDDGTVCSFPKLQSLTLMDKNWTVDDILVRIDAPALRSLCVQAYIDAYGWHSRTPRPFPALRELHFRNINRENDEEPYDGYIFACAPRTTLLTLHDTHPDSLPFVMYHVMFPETLPELHTVEVTGPHKLGYLETLRGLVEEQVHRGGSLRRLVVSRAIYDRVGAQLEEAGRGMIQVILANH